jgi:hypothetical protein
MGWAGNRLFWQRTAPDLAFGSAGHGMCFLWALLDWPTFIGWSAYGQGLAWTVLVHVLLGHELHLRLARSAIVSACVGLFRPWTGPVCAGSAIGCAGNGLGRP